MSRPQQHFDPNIAFFIPVAVAFPGVSADREIMRALLSQLDCSDAIFTASRLNLVVSDRSNREPNVHWSVRHQKLQSELVLNFFNPEQVDRIDAFLKDCRAGPGSWQAFFRGQLLELISWAAVLCPDAPELPKIEASPESRERFAQAALIASDLWWKRVFKGRFSSAGDLDEKRMSLLGPLRQSYAESSLGPDLPRAFIRGKRLCENLAANALTFRKSSTQRLASRLETTTHAS